MFITSLGMVFFEKVYENEIIGKYFTDILVSSKVIVEIKAKKILVEEN